MESAGRQRAERAFEAPAEGLEFELDGAGAVEIDETAGSVMETSPFRSEDIETIATPEAAPDDPFTTPPVDESPVSAEFADVEVFPTADEPVIEAPDAEPDIDRNLTTPINVAEVMGSEVESSAVHDDPPDAPEALDEVDESNADTQDLAARQPQQPAEVSEPSDASTGLSDDDIDRIAHRLLELAGDRIDRIAWEVLPDMAEIVVRERVREIEAEAEEHGS